MATGRMTQAVHEQVDIRMRAENINRIRRRSIYPDINIYCFRCLEVANPEHRQNHLSCEATCWQCKHPASHPLGHRGALCPFRHLLPRPARQMGKRDVEDRSQNSAPENITRHSLPSPERPHSAAEEYPDTYPFLGFSGTWRAEDQSSDGQVSVQENTMQHSLPSLERAHRFVYEDLYTDQCGGVQLSPVEGQPRSEQLQPPIVDQSRPGQPEQGEETKPQGRHHDGDNHDLYRDPKPVGHTTHATEKFASPVSEAVAGPRTSNGQRDSGYDSAPVKTKPEYSQVGETVHSEQVKPFLITDLVTQIFGRGNEVAQVEMGPKNTQHSESIAPKPKKTFAERQMEKMGHEPGTGLGKCGQGIRSPLEASVRRRNEGLGYRRKATTPAGVASPSARLWVRCQEPLTRMGG